MTKSIVHQENDIPADHILYRTYWSIMMKDACAYWDIPATEKNKLRLHEFHKKVLGYETIAGRSHEIVSLFMFEVCAHYAVEYGVFLRTSKKQMPGIEWLPLSQVLHLL